MNNTQTIHAYILWLNQHAETSFDSMEEVHEGDFHFGSPRRFTAEEYLEIERIKGFYRGRLGSHEAFDRAMEIL